MKRNSTGQGHLTNMNGKLFEEIVLNDIIIELKLFESSILGIQCYKNVDGDIIIFKQSNFYKYAKNKYNVDYSKKASKKYISDIWILKDEKELFLIEVKSQTSQGSTEEKIYGGLMLDLIYKEIFSDKLFTYKNICYIANDYFEAEKFNTPKKILKENGIEFYIDKLNLKWLK